MAPTPLLAQSLMQQRQDGPQVLSLAVADNSPDSALTAAAVIEAVNRPEPGGDLYEFLGRPRYAAEQFRWRPNTEGMKERHLAALAVLEQYLLLAYAPDVDLEVMARRLEEDPRIAQASVPRMGRFSAVPDDPQFPLPPGGTGLSEDYQWSLQPAHMNFTAAWDRITGWAHIAVLDGGPPVTTPVPGQPGAHLEYWVDHFDLQGVIAYQQSWDFREQSLVFGQSVYPRRELKNSPNWPMDWGLNPHGTHVVGLLAANANNGQGIAGGCWHCSIYYGQIIPYLEVPLAFLSMGYSGAQAINFSAAQGEVPHGSTHYCSHYNYGPGPGASEICPVLAILRDWEVISLAAAGNNKAVPLQYPAREPYVWGIAGSDVAASSWDEQLPLWAPDLWDYPTGHALAGCPVGHQIFGECGNNFGTGIDFHAPSRKILSTLPVGALFWPPAPTRDLCNDASYPSVPGIGYCTGTSMSTPLVTGVVALLRSVNPLLGADAIKDAVSQTAASHPGGLLIPDAGAAVARVLGQVGGSVAPLRLTPMFVLKSQFEADRLYTPRPQAAMAALSGLLLTDPPDTSCWFAANCLPPGNAELPRIYRTPASEGGLVAPYDDFPAYKSTPGFEPRAAFWVFSTDRVNLPGWSGVFIDPLHRYAFRDECDWRDHVYVVGDNASMHAFLTNDDFCPLEPGTQSFHHEGIEGYVLRDCPPGWICNDLNDPSSPQMLYRRNSRSEHTNALLLESQLNQPPFTSYTDDDFGAAGGAISQLGYVIVNVDSDGDGLPDGLERLLGMNRFGADSDGDGCLDGQEYPLMALQPAGRDPLVWQSGGTCP